MIRKKELLEPKGGDGLMGELRKIKACPFRLLESGHKMFYNFSSFTYLQDRMVVGGYLDEKY